MTRGGRRCAAQLWFVVAGLIALAGFAGALFYLMPRLGAADARMIRVVVPGSAVLTLDKAGQLHDLP